MHRHQLPVVESAIGRASNAGISELQADVLVVARCFSATGSVKLLRGQNTSGHVPRLAPKPSPPWHLLQHQVGRRPRKAAGRSSSRISCPELPICSQMLPTTALAHRKWLSGNGFCGVSVAKSRISQEVDGYPLVDLGPTCSFVPLPRPQPSSVKPCTAQTLRAAFLRVRGCRLVSGYVRVSVMVIMVLCA